MTVFVMSPNGIFEQYEDLLFKGRVRAKLPLSYNLETDKVEFAKPGEEEEDISINCPQMPMSLFQKALKFLEACYKENKEGFAMFALKKGEWSVVIPEQWNSYSACCYHPEKHPEESAGVVGDVHSHPPSYSSGHSTKDDLDERKTNGIYIVVSGWSVVTCHADIRGVVRGSTVTVKPDDFFDMSKVDTDPSFPPEWMQRVHGQPCTACKEFQEAQEKAKKEEKVKIALEEEQKSRVFPHTYVDYFRKAMKDDTPGELLVKSYDRWKILTKSSGQALQCDNASCGKFFSMPKCAHCNGNVFESNTVKSIGYMFDEVIMAEEAEKDKKVVDEAIENGRKEIEEEEKKKELEKEQWQNQWGRYGMYGSDTTRRWQKPTAPSSTPNVPSDSSSSTSSTEGTGESKDVIVAATGAECVVDCPLAIAKFPHRHVKRTDLFSDNPWDPEYYKS